MNKRLGTAHGVATALASGPLGTSDLAKRSEVKGPDLTSPEVKFEWSPSTTSSRNVSARARDEVVEQ